MFSIKNVLRNSAKFTGKQVFSCEFCEISKNTFCYKTPLVAASADGDNTVLKIQMKICKDGTRVKIGSF